jgi:hypothetical protein
LSNAFCVVSDHLTLFGTFFFVRSVKGTDMSENCGMNFLDTSRIQFYYFLHCRQDEHCCRCII